MPIAHTLKEAFGLSPTRNRTVEVNGRLCQGTTSGMSWLNFPKQRHSHLMRSSGPWSPAVKLAMLWRRCVRHTPNRPAPAAKLCPRGWPSQITASTKAACARESVLLVLSLLSRYWMKYCCPLSFTKSTCTSQALLRAHGCLASCFHIVDRVLQLRVTRHCIKYRHGSCNQAEWHEETVSLQGQSCVASKETYCCRVCCWYGIYMASNTHRFETSVDWRR